MRLAIKIQIDFLQDDKHKAATLPRPYDRRKIEERRQEVKKKLEEKKEEEAKPPVRLTKSFIERMSVPKHPSPEKKEVIKEPTPVRVGLNCIMVLSDKFKVGLCLAYECRIIFCF